MASKKAYTRLIIASSTDPLNSLSRSNRYIALKNANDMIRDVVKAMDKNGDEVIEYDGTYSEVWRTSAIQFGCGEIPIPIPNVHGECSMIYEKIWGQTISQWPRTCVVSSESWLTILL